MELVIGGYAQGKTEYVKEKYPDANFLEGADITTVLEQGLGENRIVFNHLHLWIREELSAGKTKEEVLALLLKGAMQNPNLIVISDEIGNGIVPMEKEERYWREETGRILTGLAKEAESVERILCGIPQKIK